MAKEPKTPFEGLGCLSLIVGIVLIVIIVYVILVFLGVPQETSTKMAVGIGILLFIVSLFGTVSNWIKGKGVYYNTCPYCKSRVNIKASVCPHCTRKL